MSTAVVNKTTDDTATPRKNTGANIENKVFIGLATLIVLIPILFCWTLVTVFFRCVSQSPRDYHRGQVLIKIDHDPITFPDPDITDIKFDLKSWQADNEGKIRQAMVRDLVVNHKNLFIDQPAVDVMKKLGSDAHLWYWAHPSKNDFGCRLARESLKYQNCIQFTVRNERVVGYVANVEKRW